MSDWGDDYDEDGIEVVGEASDGTAAVTNARALRPDVVLMDLRMPGTDGITATRQIVEDDLAQVLVLTTYDLDDYVFGALRAGAVGFLLKTVEEAALIDAVRRVARGEGVIAPEVTRRLLEALVTAPTDREVQDPPWLRTLSARELDVLTFLARGLSNAEIGRELVISQGTTKSHVSSVLAKLGCTSRLQAGIMAREAGLGQV